MKPENKSKQKLNKKPDQNSTAKTKPNLRVQGKLVSDISTLRDFLAKKSLEHAAREKGKGNASRSMQSDTISQRDRITTLGEPTQKPNQVIEGLEMNAAKGNTVKGVTDIIGRNKPEGCD